MVTTTALRLCIVTEKVAPPLDEGFKTGISRIIGELEQRTTALVIGLDQAPAEGPVKVLNKLFLSPSMLARVRSFGPEVTLYLPHSSLTPASLARARVLKALTGGPVAVAGFQPRQYAGHWPLVVRLLKPDLALVQSRTSAEELAGLGITARVFLSGVDLQRFHPVGRGRKVELRTRYGLPERQRLLLHVGHLNPKRGLEDLAALQDDETAAVVVASSSTVADPHVSAMLERMGCIIVSGYQAEVEHFYQLADVYLFPTTTTTAAVEFPLSVLEALACGIPVLARPFGGLRDALPEGEFVRYYHSPEEGAAALREMLAAPARDTGALRDRLERDFTWEAVADMVLHSLGELL